MPFLTRCSGRPSARCWGWDVEGRFFPFSPRKSLRMKEKEQQEILSRELSLWTGPMDWSFGLFLGYGPVALFSGLGHWDLSCGLVLWRGLWTSPDCWSWGLIIVDWFCGLVLWTGIVDRSCVLVLWAGPVDL
jgi:hypothetical protein